MACEEKGNLKKLAERLGIRQDFGTRPSRKIAATYDYRDEQGGVLFQVVRYEPKEFKQRRPVDNNAWVWNLNGIRKILYRLPELRAAPFDSLVFIAEGEKGVGSLVDRGMVATCSPGGAGKWAHEYSLHFRGRKVVVLPDNDDPGWAHAVNVAVSLKPVAAEVKIVKLPGLGPKEDIFDWFASGHAPEELATLVTNSPVFEPPSGGGILAELRALLERFVVLSKEQADTVTIWVAHTHAFAQADATPYLNVNSAEKRCGKTRLLEVLELLVARPWFTGRVTPAVLSRKIDAEQPTLLLDESDAAFKGDKEYSETLRGILNTGHRRGGRTSVCVGQGANIGYRDLSTFCPKAIAGIGKLPDTIADRSIPIMLKRRTDSEPIERFRRRKVEAEAQALRERLVAWISTQYLNAEPDLPQQLDDRAADGWEPLIGIADAAGGDWPENARKAAILLMAGRAGQDESTGIKLLFDIKTVFGDFVDQLPSAELANALIQVEEAPWGDVSGKPLDTRKLAALLKPYDIRPKSIRIDSKTPKGYIKEDFTDVWSRYLPRSDNLSATPQHSVSDHAQDSVLLIRNTDSALRRDVADNSQARSTLNVADVADKAVVTTEKTKPRNDSGAECNREDGDWGEV